MVWMTNNMVKQSEACIDAECFLAALLCISAPPCRGVKEEYITCTGIRLALLAYGAGWCSRKLRGCLARPDIC